MDEQRKWFLEIEFTPGKDAVKIVEILTKDLEYCLKLAIKTVADFERTDSNFKRSSTVGKMLSNNIAGYREIVRERKSQSMWQTSLSYFKKRLQPPQPSETTTLISQQPPPSKERPSTSKKIDSLKAQVMASVL